MFLRLLTFRFVLELSWKLKNSFPFDRMRRKALVWAYRICGIRRPEKPIPSFPGWHRDPECAERVVRPTTERQLMPRYAVTYFRFKSNSKFRLKQQIIVVLTSQNRDAACSEILLGTVSRKRCPRNSKAPPNGRRRMAQAHCWDVLHPSGQPIVPVRHSSPRSASQQFRKRGREPWR